MVIFCGMDIKDHKPGNRFHHSEVSKYILDKSEEISIKEFELRYKSGKDDKNAEYCVPNFCNDSIRIKINGGKEYFGTNFTVVCSRIADGEGVKPPGGLGNGNQANAGHFIDFFREIFGSDSMDESYISAEIDDSKSPSKKMEENGVENLKEKVLYNSEEIIMDIEKNTNIIIEGVAGSGKSHMLQELRKSEEYGENGSRIEVVVFHPSTSYEEFVSGIRPNFMKKKGEGDFVSQEGVFVDICNRAADNPDKKFLLFIDEINRANTSRVFGDLMLVIEDSKRVDFSKFQIGFSEREGENQPGGGKESEAKLKEPEIIDLKTGDPKCNKNTENNKRHSEGFRYGALFSSKATIPSTEDGKVDYVRLQTPIVKRRIEFNKLVVPANLHVLGTMNTTDRSVGTIDLALRRRFHWITQEPMSNKAELLKALKLSDDKDKSVGLVADWFMHANEVLGSKVGPDARLGHAYFFNKNGDAEAIAEALLNQLKEIAFTFNIDERVLWGVSKDGKFNKDNPVYCLESKKHIGAVKVIIQKDNQEEKKQLWGVQNEGEGLGRRPVVKKIDDKGKSSMADGGNNSENEGSESATSEDEQGDQQP